MLQVLGTLLGVITCRREYGSRQARGAEALWTGAVVEWALMAQWGEATWCIRAEEKASNYRAGIVSS